MRSFFIITIMILLTACSTQPTATVTSATATILPTITPSFTETPTTTPTASLPQVSPKDQAILDSVDSSLFPSVAAEGSTLVDFGMPVGSKLAVKDGAPVYVFTNAVGEDVLAATFNAGGNLEKADAIKYKLCATPEEAVDCLLPLDFVMRGGPAQIAKLTTQPFPEGVISDADIIVIDVVDSGRAIKLGWSEQALASFGNDPAKIPIRPRGYFTTKGDKILFGMAEDIQTPNNSDGSIGEVRSITLLSAFDLRIYISTTVFPFGGIVNERCKLQPYCGIGKDPENTELMKKWAENNFPPKELENTVLDFYE